MYIGTHVQTEIVASLTITLRRLTISCFILRHYGHHVSINCLLAMLDLFVLYLLIENVCYAYNSTLKHRCSNNTQ